MNVVSLVNAPASRNSSGVITVKSLCGDGLDDSLGKLTVVRSIYSRPAGAGNVKFFCFCASLITWE